MQNSLAHELEKNPPAVETKIRRLTREIAKIDDVFYNVNETKDRVLSLATVFMKAANLAEPAPVAIWDVASGRQRTDWLPPTPPMGGGWTRDGHLQAVTATPEAVHIWLVQ